MTGYDWYRVGVDIITLAIIPVGLFIAKLVMTIKNNEMKHLNEKLDTLGDGQVRIEGKIDRHLEWHAENKNA